MYYVHAHALTFFSWTSKYVLTSIYFWNSSNRKKNKPTLSSKKIWTMNCWSSKWTAVSELWIGYMLSLTWNASHMTSMSAANSFGHATSFSNEPPFGITWTTEYLALLLVSFNNIQSKSYLLPCPHLPDNWEDLSMNKTLNLSRNFLFQKCTFSYKQPFNWQVQSSHCIQG